MASLRLVLAVGGRACLFELRAELEFVLEVGKVLGWGLALVMFGQGRTRRGGERSAAFGLWDELPSGLGYSSNRLTVLRVGLL
jgi:hypothetical protein